MCEKLAGRRALITGASSGIGFVIARRFAAEGASVVCSGRDATLLGDTVDAIRSAGGSAVAITADLTEEAEIRRLVDDTVSQLDGLDLVVNNAGMDAENWADVHEWTAEAYDELMAVNARAPFLVSKYAIARMLDRGGCLLHISSICARTVWPRDAVYGMSKAALNMLSDHIAVEYATRGIRSNTIMPGAIRTPLFDDVVRTHPDGPGFGAAVTARHPVGRLGSPEEVADLAVAICACDSGFLTGSNVVFDGGYSRI